MKKTLIALAVLAASGASFSQVTITGALKMGYAMVNNDFVRSDTVAGGVVPAASIRPGDHSGFGIDKKVNETVLNFTAKEDLGGGMKLTAIMGFDGMDRGGVAGGDSSLTMATNSGTFKLATARGTDYLSQGIAGVGGVRMDGRLFSSLTSSDAVSYSSPSFSGFVVTLQHDEVTLSQGDNAPIGLGVGASGGNAIVNGANYQRRNMIAATYTAGPLAANLGYRVYDQAIGANAKDFKDNIRAAASYDFGVVKVGAGFDARTYNFKGDRMDAMLSVSVPFGAVKLGADYGTRTVNGVSATSDGNQAGYGLALDYALSKRTSLQAQYASYDAIGQNATVASGNNGKSTQYTAFLISHSF